MKNKLFCTILVVLSSLTVIAQNPRFSTGVEGGPGIITLKEPYEPYLRNLGIGFSTGIFFQYHAKKVFSLKLAPAFERKGGWEDENHYNLDYLVIPLLFRAEIGSRIKGFLNAGPFVGYLLDAFITADYYDGHKDYMQYLKRFDAGITAGLGMIIPLGKMFDISVELRNSFGLYQIVTDEESADHNWEWKTYSANLLLGFSYNFGERKVNQNGK